MLHLLPTSGKWIQCTSPKDGKCKLKYHAPGEEGEIAESLLWEAYASEELYREPDEKDIQSGIKRWKNSDGLLHRDYDLPAEIQFGPERVYYERYWQNGKLHRNDDNPAVVDYVKGQTVYLKDGKIHRDNHKPAVISSDGKNTYYLNGNIYIPKHVSNTSDEGQ